MLIFNFIKSLQINFDTTSPFGILLLGLVTGMRHALDADHVAAISSIISTKKNIGFHHLPFIGIFWGIGHTIALLFAGIIVLIFAINIPKEISETLEVGVGIILIYLAITAISGFSIIKLFKGILHKGELHTHTHIHPETNVIHNHIHTHEKNHYHEHRSLIIGIIHGLAGSGALLLVILSTINSIPLGLVYIAIFGLGSIVSMMVLSIIIGIPFSKTKSSQKVYSSLKYSTSIFTLITGMWLISELLFL